MERTYGVEYWSGVESKFWSGVPWISDAHPSSKHAKYIEVDVLNQCPGLKMSNKLNLQV